MPPSRGITLPFFFMYDSTLYYLAGNRQGNAQWSRVGSAGLSPYFIIFQFRMELLGVPFVSATAAHWTEIDPILGTNVYCTYTFGYVYQDATGARHNLNLTNFSNDSRSDCASDVSGTAPNGFDGRVILQGNEGPIMGSIDAIVNKRWSRNRHRW